MPSSDEPAFKTNTSAPSQTFIIRIWNERIKEDGIVDYWHGSIDQVGRNKRLYFYDLDSISRFIHEQTGVLDKAGGSWIRTFLYKVAEELMNGYKFIRDGIKREA